MKCPGLHCPGCGDGGRAALYGGAGLAAAAAAAWVFPRLAWIAATLAGCWILAVVLALAVVPRLARRPGRTDAAAWQEPRPAPLTAAPLAGIPRAVPPVLEVSARPAIGPGRELHLHLNVTTGQLAAILRHHTEGN